MSIPASTFGWSAYLRIDRKTSKVDGEEFTMESGSPAISSMAEEREESMEDVRREGMSSSAEIWYNDGSERVRRCSWSVNSAIAAGVDGDEKWKIFMAFEVCFRCFVYKRVARGTESKKRNQIVGRYPVPCQPRTYTYITAAAYCTSTGMCYCKGYASCTLLFQYTSWLRRNK